MNEELLSGDATPSLESLHQVRLTALLHDLVDDRGRMEAAEALRVNYKTLATAIESGRLTRRLSDALERLLLAREVEASVALRERVRTLEGRMEAEEEALRGCREELLATIEAGDKRLEEEAVQRKRAVEGRLAALESHRAGAEAASSAGVESGRQVRRAAYDRRRHPALVTGEPEPGEEEVYGEATPLVVEWRRVSAERARAGDKLGEAMAEERMRELEIEMIGEFGLTLPPAAQPWDDSDRRDRVYSLTETLGRVRRERVRAQWRRWVRRVLTLGLWRK